MRFLKIGFYSICCLVLLIGYLLIGQLHADSPKLIITEIKVRNDTVGYDEYIELYNPGNEAISLNNYYIGYINTPTPTIDQEFSRSVVAQGQLEPGHYFLLAKNDLDTRLPLSQKSPFSSLSDSAGTIQVTDEAGTIIDEVRWTSSSNAATSNIVYMPGTTQAKGQSITRSMLQDSYITTPASWQITTPTPESSTLLPLPPERTDPVDQTDIPSDTSPNESDPESEEGAPQTISSSDIEITELLPNPAAPATDEADEYIELHNISSSVVNLNQYKLQAGNNFTYSYTFPDHELQPDAYEIFKVSTTHLLLSNSSGRSRLLNPSGEVISQTEPYDAADAGKAWALIEDIWQWTDTPTPGAVNIASATVSAVKTNATTSKATKSTKKPVAKAPKASVAKTKSATASKKSSAPTSKQNTSGTASSAAKLHPFILAGVGVSTVLYGLYEYRQDISNTVRRLRGNRSLRRELGSHAQGPGGN